MNPKKAWLGVVVKGWPRLSETFIAQELVALEESGIDFEIWPLRHPTDQKTHPLHRKLAARVNYLPEYLKDDPRRVLEGYRFARSLPGFPMAWAKFRRDLARDRTPNRLRRFGQACVLARELPPHVTVLYAHFLHTPSSVAQYAALMRGLPWSFSAHAKDIWTSPEWELREKLGQDPWGASFGATCTAYGADHLRSLAADPQKIDLVYHGLDLSRFPAPPDRAARDGDRKLRLMSVGRLVEKKGFDTLIHALARLPKDIDWHWTHIGGGVLKDHLQAMAADCGIAERITWRGSCDQPEVIEEMRRSDYFVLPSRVAKDGDRDGLPNVLMEAASQKLPIIATPVAAIPEFIDHKVQGYLSEDDPEKLAAAILECAALEDKGQAMAEAAYARLCTAFRMQPGIDILASRLVNCRGDLAQKAAQ